MILFDDEYIYRTYVASKEKEAEERAERKAEKRAEKKAKEVTRKLYEKGSSPEDIAEILDVPMEEIKQWLGLAFV